jgi:hypothetical protein
MPFDAEREVLKSLHKGDSERKTGSQVEIINVVLTLNVT